MDRIICVVGPTASGKTKLAVQLAKLYGGEVVSCDSMQLYRGMVIGTAAPPLLLASLYFQCAAIPNSAVWCISKVRI